MVEKTIFKNNYEIISFVAKKYNLYINNVKLINRGSANLYSLNNDEYMLKEFQSKYTKDDVDKEIAVINHLREYNINVPEYIKTINKECCCLYKGKIIIIQKFIDGYTMNNCEGTYEQTIECAEYYGKIVNALKKFQLELPYSNLSEWCNKANLDNSIKKYIKLIQLLDLNDINDLKIKKDFEEKISMINDIKDKINFSNIKKLTIVNTHGDYNVLQFIYKDGKINSVLDFASACRMPIIWEIIRSYSYIDSDIKNGEFNLDTFIDYVKAINKYISLNKYDIKYMPYLYLIQILCSDYGYKQYIYDHEKTNLLIFAFFRTNIARYLFKRSDEIIERLLKELF